MSDLSKEDSSGEEHLPALKAILKQLDEELEKEAPDLGSYLEKINKNLRQFPDLGHLLTDEEIAPLYDATLRKASVVLNPPKKSKGKSKVKNDSQADLDALSGGF